MNLTDTVSIPSQVMARQVGGETVILDLASGTYFGLDAVGARVWELLAAGHSLAQTCERMVAEYEVEPGVLQADVISLVNALADKQLVQRK